MNNYYIKTFKIQMGDDSLFPDSHYTVMCNYSVFTKDMFNTLLDAVRKANERSITGSEYMDFVTMKDNSYRIDFNVVFRNDQNIELLTSIRGSVLPIAGNIQLTGEGGYSPGNATPTKTFHVDDVLHTHLQRTLRAEGLDIHIEKNLSNSDKNRIFYLPSEKILKQVKAHMEKELNIETEGNIASYIKRTTEDTLFTIKKIVERFEEYNLR